MPLIILLIGFVLIVYNYRAIKKEDKAKLENDSLNISFQSVLQDSKEELNDYKMEIGLLRKDIAESLTELQEEIIEIKNNLNMLKNDEEIYENKEELESSYFLNNNYVHNDYEMENNKNIKKANVVDHIENETDANSVVDLDIKEGLISEISFSEKLDSNKTQNIKNLLKDGLTEEQICHELSVSKGEVLLVKGLFKK